MYKLSFSRMTSISDASKDRLRELTFGRENESPMYRWTFHSDAWCTIAQDTHGTIRAWACLTLQDDYLPVAGVYVEPRHRRRGLAEVCAKLLLGALTEGRHLAPGSKVQAVSELWPRWPAVIESAGLTFLEWA
jgi:GNAT superfamily N-acetyltransferase